MDITVVVLTFNEELNLPAALDSVKGWASRVFVVDSFSTDRTVDIALDRAADGVQVVQHDFVNYAEQWRWALSKLPIETSWVMKLDADERVTAELRKELDGLPAQQAADGYYIRWQMYFMDQPMRWGAFSSSSHLRVWRRGLARVEGRSVNEHLIVDGTTRQLSGRIEHRDFKSLSEWLEKHNRYASLEAREIYQGNLGGDVKPSLFGKPDQRRLWFRRRFYCLPCRYLIYRLYLLVFKLGILDGKAGYQFAILHSNYLNWINMKLNEARRRGRPPEVHWPVRGQPHPDLLRRGLVYRESPATIA